LSAGHRVSRLFNLCFCRKLQLFKPANQNAVFACALVAFRFDGFENRAQAIKQLQQASDDLAVRGQLAFAQQAEQIFSGVSQLFQPLEAQESSGPLMV